MHDIIPDSQGEFYIHYRVWKKSVSSSNKLTLGESLNAYSRANQRAMYGIAIKPLNQAKREVAENQSRAAPN